MDHLEELDALVRRHGTTAGHDLPPPGHPAVGPCRRADHAQAIARAAKNDDHPRTAVEGFTNHDGRGLTGAIESHAVLVGRRTRLTRGWSLTAPEDLVVDAHRTEAEGTTPVWAAWDGAIHGGGVAADTMRGPCAVLQMTSSERARVGPGSKMDGEWAGEASRRSVAEPGCCCSG